MKENTSPYKARDGILGTAPLGAGVVDHLTGTYARKFVNLN
ncbi:MAG TPA: hypothetical protein VF896_00410 [Anaerolineales bacterium]